LDTVVIVGASLAGLRAAQGLREEGHEGELVVVGEERAMPYDRPPLTKELLAGAVEADQIALRGADEVDARWELGRSAVALDLGRRRVSLDDGRELAFDGLVIATGAKPRRLAAVDVAHPAVHELRTLDDALALRAALAAGTRLVVVGTGFIGVEVASTARALGADVVMVSLDPPLAIAGAVATAEATRALEANGVALHIGRVVSRIEGAGAPVVVVLDDGTRLEGDAIVCAVGVTPATRWLRDSGLDVSDGVLCDERLAAVGAERIVAAGDVARWPNGRCGTAAGRIEHWTNATEQGRAAARTLVYGRDAPAHRSLPLFWSDHFGRRMQSVGLPDAAERFEVQEDVAGNGALAVAGYRDDRLVAGLTWSNPRALVALRARLADPLLTP
jgi:NADPH-dependent 2,4-dienoyl-CoA reductase/sulfur reductase-like enzyme